MGNLRQKALDLLRFPLAVVVLVMHLWAIRSFEFAGEMYSLESQPLLRGICLFVDGFFAKQSVPIYFFISGFVFFLGGQFTREVYIRKLKNRVKTLLIPYIIWNSIAIILIGLSYLPCFSSLFQGIRPIPDLSLSAIFECFWHSGAGIFPTEANWYYPQNVPLWFLRDLMIVVLCTPLLYWIITKIKYYWVIVLGIIWFVFQFEGQGHFPMILTAFFFFSFGAYMSITQKDMLIEFGNFRMVSI